MSIQNVHSPPINPVHLPFENKKGRPFQDSLFMNMFILVLFNRYILSGHTESYREQPQETVCRL